LIALYQNADVFVFPSVYEGFGLPVLEALSAGTPVVSTRSASIPEVGGDCVAYFEAGALDGLIVQLRDILAWDETQRRVFTDAARIHVGGFNWQRTARQTMTCFEEAVAAG
jgi:glycosyltransferase involved in cell wall biosynthesis